MKKLVYSFFISLYLWFWVRPMQVIELLRRPCFYTSPTYYPEYPEKLRSHWSQFWNQMGEILRYSRINTLYFMCGYDVMTRAEQRRYVHYNTFMRRRVELNKSNQPQNVAILRDKLQFARFAQQLGVATPEIVYYTQEGRVLSFPDGKAVDEQTFMSHPGMRLFCKPLDGQCGKGIFVLEMREGSLYIGEEAVTFAQVQERCAGGCYLMQRFIQQHNQMAALHPQSINTIRLITIRSLRDGQVHILPSILRVGAGDSVVDNTTQGGLAIGIHLDTGMLKQYGFYKPQFGTKVEQHPDSQIRFSEFQIPYFEEVKRQAVLFHNNLPGIHSIGWDIAIGPEGPIFVEGNDNWELTGPQTCNGGFRQIFEEYFF